MSTPRTILITGGIGSGKSSVCSWLRSQGVLVYDSDAATKEIYSKSPAVVLELEKALGFPLRSCEGSLDKKLLASLIFSDPARLSSLEAIIHPLVLEDFIQWREALKSSGSPFVAMESAIALSRPLFHSLFDAAVIVDAPIDLRLERVCRRSGCSREEALARINSQNDATNFVGEEFYVLPRYVIMNNSSLEDLYTRCEKVFEHLTALWK